MKTIKVKVSQLIPFTEHKKGDIIEISQKEYNKNPDLFTKITSSPIITEKFQFKVGDQVAIISLLEDMEKNMYDNDYNEGDDDYWTSISYNSELYESGKITDIQGDYISLDDNCYYMHHLAIAPCIDNDDFGNNDSIIIPSHKIMVYNGGDIVAFDKILQLHKYLEPVRACAKLIEGINAERFYIDEGKEYKLAIEGWEIEDIQLKFSCHEGYLPDLDRIVEIISKL